jgi:Family of unknown function (DUF6157)
MATFSIIRYNTDQTEADMHSTNYSNAFIAVAEDCKAQVGTIPPERSERTIAQIQYGLIANHPYRFTSDEIIFAAHAEKHNIASSRLEHERQVFFSKGQACLRASALGKTYGWGIHANQDSKVALFSRDSKAYQDHCANETLKQLKAMKNSR